MRRFLTAFLLFSLVFCLLPVYAFAANNTYVLDDLGMSIDLPDDYVVFTRDIKNDDPNLSAYGLTKDGMSSLMLEQDIYLNAWDKDVNYEIIITMTESILEDYNQISNTTLSTLISALETEYASAGVTFIRSDIYQHSQAKFAKIYISQMNNGEAVYGLQYNTVYAGKAINITLHSYSGEINSSKEAIIQDIVDSVCFDTQPQLNTAPAQTDAFKYTDPTSGMSFTVPENWVETPMIEEREFIDVKFTSNLEEGLCIIFSCEDIFELEEFTATLSEIEKHLLSRAAVGNDIFTKADIAEMCDCKEADVSIVTYGEKEYYSVDTVKSGTAYGLTVSVPMVYLLRCENGYLYIFQFNGGRDNSYFKDFKSLVTSTEYPSVEDDSLLFRRSIGIAFITLVLTLVTIIILWKHRQKRKRGTATSFNNTNLSTKANFRETNSEAVSATTGVPELTGSLKTTDSISVRFCYKCGCKIEHGSRFCHKCGARIITEEEE